MMSPRVFVTSYLMFAPLNPITLVWLFSSWANPNGTSPPPPQPITLTSVQRLSAVRRPAPAWPPRKAKEEIVSQFSPDLGFLLTKIDTVSDIARRKAFSGLPEIVEFGKILYFGLRIAPTPRRRSHACKTAQK